MDNDTKQEESIRMEDRLRMLEEGIRELESGKLGLQESMEAYEKLTKLVKEASDELTAAETKLKILREDGSLDDF